MSKKRIRVIGTTESAISKAELDLGFGFPAGFRNWLVLNNGTTIDDITIFPVFDERDPRKTWDSIVRNFKENWRSWLDNYGPAYNSSHLLPFGEFGSGDYFCFDFSNIGPSNEAAVVIWFHETGKTELVSDSFEQFVEFAKSGKLNY